VKERSKLPSEGCHWYLPDGSPYYTVLGKNGKERATTLADARKVGAGPSTTTILKIIEKPQLNNYHEEKIFKAVLDLAWDAILEEGTDTNKLFAKTKAISRAKGKAAAKRGDILHANIENFLWFGAPLDSKWARHCKAVKRVMEKNGFDLEKARSEHSFFHPLGYGGKVDYHEPTKVADFKTKEEIETGKQYAYIEHTMQLASYRKGLFLDAAECWNFFVGEKDVRVLPVRHEEADLVRAWEMFKHLLEYWKLDRKYFPEIGNHERS